MHWNLKIRLLITVLFFSLINALTDDQIYKSDWQTANVGVPFDSISLDDKLLTLSNLGIFSVINSTNGDILYRFNTDIDTIDSSSGLVKSINDNDNEIVLFLNFDTFEKSKLLVWNFDDALTPPSVKYEIDLPYKILSVFSVNSIIYIVDERRIFSLINNEFDILFETDNKLINSSKINYNKINNELFVFVDIDNKTYYSAMTKIDFQLLNGCPIQNILFNQHMKNLLICNKDTVYEFDKYSIQKINKKKNSIDDKISVNSLLNSDIDSYELIDDFVVINSNNTINFFNYKSLNISLGYSFETPKSFQNSIYHKFNIVSNSVSNLFIVTKDHVLEYYLNGKLQWKIDESFSNIIDIVIISSNFIPDLSIDDLIIEENSNILISYITRLKNNYNSLFGNSIKKSTMNQLNRFGMSKKMIALTENGKIGIYNLFKNSNSSSQLIDIFNPDIKFVKLYSQNERLLGLTIDSTIYEIDVDTGRISLLTENFLNDNFKILKHSESEIDYIQTNLKEFYTTSISLKSNTVNGHLINDDNQLNTWNYNSQNEIVSLTKRSYDNNEVAQNAIILPDKSVLYKYLIPNLGVITSFKKGIVFFDLINLITGQSYAKFTKEINDKINPFNDILIKFEENFIIFTLPHINNQLDSEICVIDLFESLQPDNKLTNNIKSYSAFDDLILPSFASQCFILPNIKIDDLAISKTKNNISFKNLIIRSSFGKILSIPKMIIDGRRNGFIGDFNNIKLNPIPLNNNGKNNLKNIYASKFAKSISSRFPYDPLLNLNPQSILTHSRKLINNPYNNQFKILLTEPTELESTTYVISINNDIFVTFLKPSGSFDRLTDSFKTKFLIITIIILLSMILLLYPKIANKKLSGLLDF